MEKAGERIPGSVLYRSFCKYCGEPIRLSCPVEAEKCQGSCCHRPPSRRSNKLSAIMSEEDCNEKGLFGSEHLIDNYPGYIY